MPDLFREGQGVVAEGTLAADGTFIADTVLAKHDENYMPKEVADKLKEKGVWQEGKPMIVELGHFALDPRARRGAAIRCSCRSMGAHRGDPRLMAPASIAARAATDAGCARLPGTDSTPISCRDFSVPNVAENSHSAKPLLYKISGVWGNHEGSMLLWVLILALFGAAVALFGSNLPPNLKSRVLSVQGSIGFAFLLFIVLASNPFLRLRSARSKAMASIPSCRTRHSPSIRRFSMRAMSAFRLPSPLRWPR